MARPVLVMGRLAEAGLAALAECFDVTVLGAGEDAAAVIAAKGWESAGIIASDDQALPALKAAAAAGERVNALVFVSPHGLLDDEGPELPALRTEVRTPKAVILGTADPAMPRSAPAHFRRILPRCNVVLVFEAGADVPADRPDAFASAAGDFLDRQGRFSFMTESVAIRR